jgi:hypothetical protein
MIPKRWKAASAALTAYGFAVLIAGCTSAPQLKGSIRDHLRKTEVIYVMPKDTIIVTDPALREAAHASKFVGLTFLTGGLFDVGALGVGVYFAGNKFPGGMEGRVEAARKVFADQHWEERMRAAAQAAGGASKLQGATWVTYDHTPGMVEMPKITHDGGIDDLVIIAPEIQMASEGDQMRILVDIEVLAIPPPQQVHACRECDYMHAEEPTRGPNYDSQRLLVSQDLVAVDGGKTWEEQKQAGHRLHDLTEGDYAMFWLQGDPPPLKTFMDFSFQSLQAQLTHYFGGQAQIPGPLPTLKMVVQP